MPRYDFKCPQCGEVEDVVLSIDRLDTVDRFGQIVCDCGVPMKRTISVPGIILRGGGWASKS